MYMCVKPILVIGSNVKLVDDNMIYKIIGFTNDNQCIVRSTVNKDNTNLNICCFDNIEKVIPTEHVYNLSTQEEYDILISTHGG
jgi:hypothetical protein